MLKFIAGFLTCILLTGIYLSNISIPEYILYMDCQQKREAKPPLSIIQTI